MPINMIGAGSAGGEAGLDLLFEEVLTGDTTMVTYDNIPQTYNDLLIVITARSSATDTYGSGGEIIMELNQVTDTASYRAAAYRYGTYFQGITPASTNGIGRVTAFNSPTGYFGSNQIRLIDYASTTVRKIAQSHATTYEGAYQNRFFGWVYSTQKNDNSDAVTRLDFSLWKTSRQSHDFIAGSTFRIYGVR